MERSAGSAAPFKCVTVRRSPLSPRRMLVSLLSTLLIFGWIATALAVEATATQVKRVAMIGLTVSDMERSVAFYERLFGFKKVAEFEVTGTAYDTLSGVFAKPRLDEQFLAVLEELRPGSVDSCWSPPTPRWNR